MGKKPKIRALALCVFWRDDMIFVGENYDTHKQAHFYRAIGGKIEFQELAADTLRREVLEEIDAEITNIRYLGILENIFTYLGNPGHEICLMFDADFMDDARNADDYVVQGTDDGEVLFNAMWKPLAFFRAGNAPLYPNGLLELLDADANHTLD